MMQEAGRQFGSPLTLTMPALVVTPSFKQCEDPAKESHSAMRVPRVTLFLIIQSYHAHHEKA